MLHRPVLFPLGEAQTVANCYTAVDLGLTVIPVLNKIDLPAAEPDRVLQEIEDVIGLDSSSALSISAKTGQGVDEVLEQIVTLLPPPRGKRITMVGVRRSSFGEKCALS